MARTRKAEPLTIEGFDPVRTASDKAALAEGYHFDRKRANAPVDFIESLCRLPSGRGGGQPFKLLDWEKILVWSLYGWVDDEGLRRFREGYCSVAKKNGKTTLVSALLLYALMGDGELSPEIHLNAVDKSQAGRLFAEAMKMIKASPGLRKRLRVVQGQKRIEYRKVDGEIRTNSADVDSKDGANASMIVFDELHLQKSWAMWSIYRYAGIGRADPLKISITTAGVNRLGPCWSRHTHAWDVLDGRVIDVRFFPLVFGPKPGAKIDVDDRKHWFNANPSLGHTLSIKDFAADLEDAKRLPSELLDFRRYRLNEWVNEGGRFFDMESWAECPQRRTLEECIASGDPCWAGLDLSSTRDLTAFALVYYNEADGALDVFVWTWVPKGEAKRRAGQGIPYLRWADEKRLELTKGRRINYRRIVEVIEDVHQRTGFKVLNMDSFNAQLVGGTLKSKGVPVQQVGQGWKSMSEPTKELERLIVEGAIRHGHEEDPVLTWTVGNAVASEQEDRGNVTLSKKRSAEKIDPVQAVLNGLLGWMDELRGELAHEEPMIGVLA